MVKTTYLKSDGLHAFYIGSNSYASTTGERLLETVTSERLNWDTDNEGSKTLRACYDGTWVRTSEDNGTTWVDAEERIRFDTEIGEEQLMPAGISLDERTRRLVRF